MIQKFQNNTCSSVIISFKSKGSTTIACFPEKAGKSGECFLYVWDYTNSMLLTLDLLGRKDVFFAAFGEQNKLQHVSQLVLDTYFQG